jgi:hypothetical protein
VLLGHPVNSALRRPDIDLADYATGRMAEIFRMKRLEEEALAHVTQAAVLPSASLAEGEPSTPSVEAALRRMHDLPYLGSSPLAKLRAVSARLPATSPTSVDRGRAVHQVLVEAIEKLKPEGPRPAHSSPREWHHYMVLHEAYLMDRSTETLWPICTSPEEPSTAVAASIEPWRSCARREGGAGVDPSRSPDRSVERQPHTCPRQRCGRAWAMNELENTRFLPYPP